MDQGRQEEYSLSEEEFPQHRSSNLVQNATVNYKDEAADKTKTGGWRVIPLIFGSETCERMAVTGLVFNFVYYLVVEMHVKKATAVSLSSNTVGTGYLCTLIGGLLADQWLGRYWTIVAGCLLEFVGLVVMTLQTTIPSLKLLSVIYVGAFTVALGNGLIKACAAPFGADQFDAADPYEKKLSARYFSWYVFFSILGSILAVTVLAWVQIDYGFGWGFGTNAVLLLVCIVAFVSGARVYRYSPCIGSPLTGVANVFWQACRNMNHALPKNPSELYELTESKHELKFKGFPKLPLTDRLRFLDKACILPHDIIAGGQFSEPEEQGVKKGRSIEQNLPTVTEVEEVKQILYLFPILLATFFFWTVYAQISTYSVVQGIYMDREVGTLNIPSASVGFFLFFFILITLVIFDRGARPVLRRYTGLEQGITCLQRMGVGIFVSVLAMLIAGLVEAKRQRYAHSHAPTEMLSIFWLIPQYSLLGMAEGMMYSGHLEFFYYQSPPRLRTVGTSMCICTLSIGYFVSSALVNVVQKYTKSSSSDGWLGENLNKGHLDRFYYMLCVIDASTFVIFVIVARWFKYTTFNMPTPMITQDLEAPTIPQRPDASQ